MTDRRSSVALPVRRACALPGRSTPPATGLTARDRQGGRNTYCSERSPLRGSGSTVHRNAAGQKEVNRTRLRTPSSRQGRRALPQSAVSPRSSVQVCEQFSSEGGPGAARHRHLALRKAPPPPPGPPVPEEASPPCSHGCRSQSRHPPTPRAEPAWRPTSMETEPRERPSDAPAPRPTAGAAAGAGGAAARLGAGGDSGTMSSQDAEVDMKEVELNELEPEKQPMTAAAGPGAGGAEKNGLVKVKVAEDGAEAEEAARATGLSKEELLRVAGSPGWARARWALLLLFWLGWLGMLAGAVVIIVRAPRCRELPAQRWWHQGALYRVADLRAFGGPSAGDLAGLRGRLDYLSSLKVKGLVLGPIHQNRKDDVAGTDLQRVDSSLGSPEDFDGLLQSAKKKSIRVILDLTPNYRGQNSWFPPAQAHTVATKVKAALSFWLQAGVDGFQVRDVESLTNASSFLAEWENITKSFGEDRLLIAGTNASDLQQILSLLESTQDLLLTSSYLSSANVSGEHTKSLVTQYLNSTGGHWCSWSLSQAGLLSSFVPAQLLRLYQLLLFTLPGTPVFSYGDEIGLQAAGLPGQPAEAPSMPWDESALPDPSGSNMTVKSQSEDPASLLSLFRRLGDQRAKERSLLHGDFHTLSASSSSPGLFSYIRHWDQNERFLVVLNFGDVDLSAQLGADDLPPGSSLPARADLLLSTQPGRAEGSALELGHLHLGPHEGLLLYFPYGA
ncbi:amino acid transporter heavy chain SLC3A2 [Ctenodactylus gundi]